MVREHPAHKCLQETRQRWFAVLKELGLTAKAKKALDAIGVEEYDPDFC
jgi:hypothetical protein